MALFLLASASAAATTSIIFSCLLSFETSLISKSPMVAVQDMTTILSALHDEDISLRRRNNNSNRDNVVQPHEKYYYDHPPARNRQLQLSMTDEVEVTNNIIENNSNNNNQQQINNAIINGQQSTSSPGVILNMLRRARDKVDEKDVPFLLQVPYTNSDVIYKIMTECYGLVGREYWDLKELQRDQKANVVDQFYVSSHDRPKEVSCYVVQ